LNYPSTKPGGIFSYRRASAGKTNVAMAAELDDQYLTYEGRLASFQKSKKRGSAANRGTKQLGWPHKSISPASVKIS
jgi:hypothetical protein